MKKKYRIRVPADLILSVEVPDTTNKTEDECADQAFDQAIDILEAGYPVPGVGEAPDAWVYPNLDMEFEIEDVEDVESDSSEVSEKSDQ